MNWRELLVYVIAICVVVSSTVFAVWWTASHPRVIVIHDKPSVVIIVKP